MQYKNSEKNVGQEKERPNPLKLFYNRFLGGSRAMQKNMDHYKELLRYYGKEYEIGGQYKEGSASKKKKIIQVLKPQVEKEIASVKATLEKIEEIRLELGQIRADLVNLEQEVKNNIALRKREADEIIFDIRRVLMGGMSTDNPSREVQKILNTLEEAKKALEQDTVYPSLLRFVIENNKNYLVRDHMYIERLNRALFEYELKQAQIIVFYSIKYSISQNINALDSIQNIRMDAEKMEKLSKLNAEIVLENPQAYDFVQLSKSTQNAMRVASNIQFEITDTIGNLLRLLEKKNKNYDNSLNRNYSRMLEMYTDTRRVKDEMAAPIIEMLQQLYDLSQGLQESIKRATQPIQNEIAPYLRKLEEIAQK